MFSRGETVAIFQFESPGMQKWMKALQPNCLDDLVAMNALYRPGPMSYIPNFVEGKKDPAKINYPDPCLEGILKETYGIMVYQEQVMQVSQKIAGFSLGGADMLRRAMGKKKPEVLMGKKKEFVEGALKEGFTTKHAEDIFEIMIPFAGYGFNKSHAAAYTVLAYRTGWLKCHYPAEFMAANLTNEITTTDGLPFYIEEARKMGVAVDAPDVNRSDINFDVVEGRIVFGLRGIKGMGTGAAAAIVKERKDNGPFTSFMNFLERCLKLRDSGTDEETGEKRAPKQLVNKKAIEVLIQTGGFDHLDQNRATLLKNYEAAIAYEEKILAEASYGQVSLFADTGIKEFADFKFEQVEEMPKMALLNMEKELIGCFVSGHPLDDWRNIIEKCSSINSQNIMRYGKIALAEKAAQAENGERRRSKNNGTTYIAIGMINGIRTIMTKKGEPMAFAKLDDMNGSIDVTFFPKTWAQLKDTIQNETVYAFRGSVDMGTPEMPRETPSLVVNSIEDINSLQQRSISEVHIQLEPGFDKVKEISQLKDIIFGEQGMGNCIVFFHLDNINGRNYIVKANGQLNVSHSEDFLSQLKDLPNVVEVWIN